MALAVRHTHKDENKRRSTKWAILHPKKSGRTTILAFVVFMDSRLNSEAHGRNSWQRNRSTNWWSKWILCGRTDWVTGWLAEWLGDWVTGWLSDWLGDWVTGWLSDWLGDWLGDWLTISWAYSLDPKHFLREEAATATNCSDRRKTKDKRTARKHDDQISRERKKGWRKKRRKQETS